MTDLALGPIHYHWSADRKLDFYARIADEAPIDTVYLGEVICSKRAPFFEDQYQAVTERLERGGKTVIWSTLCEVMLKREREMIAQINEMPAQEFEVNDSSALFHISGRPHRIGPFVNVYNEDTLTYLAGRGATHVCLPSEIPRSAVAVLCGKARELGVGVEVQAFGRISLAVSARCYHARAHNRSKDNCLFVCEQDPDGMALQTLTGQDFLAINGIQTLSHTYLNLLAELPDMAALGIGHIRLNPQSLDMIAVARTYRGVLDGALGTDEGTERLRAICPGASMSNGFWHGRAGHTYAA